MNIKEINSIVQSKVDYYNKKRPHDALGGKCPYQIFFNKEKSKMVLGFTFSLIRKQNRS